MERLTKGIDLLDLETPKDYGNGEILEENTEETSHSVSLSSRTEETMVNRTAEFSQSSLKDSSSGRVADNGIHLENQMLDGDFNLLKGRVIENVVVPIDPETKTASSKRESDVANAEVSEVYVDDFSANKQAGERRLPNAVLPLLRYYQYESSESSSR